MKYRKKSIVVEAMQYTGENVKEILDWMRRNGKEDKLLKKKNGLFINTLEGKMKASVGDYIIKGIKDEFYPCKPDVFEETYDKIGCLTFNSKVALAAISFMLGAAWVILLWNIVIKLQTPKQPPVIIEKASSVEHSYLGEHIISFYNLNKNRTAQGTEVREGHTVACDINHIPANSYIYIEGWGVRQCVDTGSAIKGKHIDLYLSKPTEELLKMGTQKKKVYLLGEG